ncbi:putative germin-like protein 2-1 [Bienertia sinuspersici]
MDVKAEDFFFSGLDVAGDTKNRVGSNVTTVSVLEFPGLNTLGISLARIDYAPYGGLNTPHTHPRATELLTVLEGNLYVGFVTTNMPNGENKLFAKELKRGDVFIFPQGLIHFQINIGKYPAVALSSLSSQNPGVLSIANAVFGAEPPISVRVLSKAFQLDEKIVKNLQSKFDIKPITPTQAKSGAAPKSPAPMIPPLQTITLTLMLIRRPFIQHQHNPNSALTTMLRRKVGLSLGSPHELLTNLSQVNADLALARTLQEQVIFGVDKRGVVEVDLWVMVVID